MGPRAEFGWTVNLPLLFSLATVEWLARGPHFFAPAVLLTLRVRQNLTRSVRSTRAAIAASVSRLVQCVPNPAAPSSPAACTCNWLKVCPKAGPVSADPKARRPFQYSLGTFLIATSVAGVSLGLLGRLFLRDPEICLRIVTLLSTIGPFLLAVGTILWIGLRGRRWGLTSWGVLLLLTPVIGIGASYAAYRFMGPGPGGLGLLSSQQLLQQRLPNQVDAPWVWNELESRLQAKSLSQKDADDAVKILIAHMTTTRPNGWDQPLHWQDQFLSKARQAGMISPPLLLGLCDAFYGPKPIIEPLRRLREGKNDLQIGIRYGSPWISQSGLGVELLWQVERVLLDGKPTEAPQPEAGHAMPDSRFSGHWQGSRPVTVKAGDHQVVVEVQCA